MRNTTRNMRMWMVGLMLSAPSAVTAAQTVTNLNDAGDGSLRKAIADAAATDTIVFQAGLTGTITLTTGELLIDKNLTITGPGAAALTISGNHASRVFHISPGLTVSISSLTITNGYASSSSGAGIRNQNATLTVSNVTLSGNTADGSGGGIENDGAFGRGSASLMVINSTLSGNIAGGNPIVSLGGGGGIINNGSEFGGSATLTVIASTLSGNTAAYEGGGILNYGVSSGNAMLTVIASTLSGNSAGFDGGCISSGGSTGNAMLTVVASTLSGNSAHLGGGIASGSAIEIGNTILNAGASGENLFIFTTGTVTSRGYNLSSDAVGGDGTTGPGGLLNATGDIRNTDPLLGPMQDNGGPTFTHALLAGSPAIDQGKRDTILALASNTDQRGFLRPVDNLAIANAAGGDGSDIGAFEVQVVNRCPHSQGFWKNNPSLWPVSSLTLGSQTYSKSELLALLKTSTTTDASLILARQLIAAKLNIANGSDPSAVSSTITHADGLLNGFGGKLPYKVSTASTTGKAMTKDAGKLDSYNNGLLTPNCTP